MFTSKKLQRSFRSRLAIEQLDARIVPAVVLTKLDLDGDGQQDDIRIVGDGQSSFVSISDDGAGAVQVHIDANGNSKVDKGDLDQNISFSNNSLVLDIQLKGGQDLFAYGFSSALTAGSRSFNIDLGSGKDGIFFVGGSPQAGSNINMNVNAGSGDDTIGIGFAAIKDSYVNIQTSMGNGNDTYNLILGAIDYESSVNVNTDLGNGKDTNNVTIDSVGYVNHADMDMAIIGGNGKDTVNVSVQKGVGGGAGQPSSHLGVNVDLGNGDDTYVGQLTGLNFILDDKSQAIFAVKGGAGKDTLTMERKGTGPLRIDDGAMMVIDLDGGAGKDQVNANFSGGDAWQLETATSRLKVRLDGGAGNDQVNCLITNNQFTKGDFDIACYGGAGDDAIWFATANNGGTPTYGPTGKVQIDGGLGKDSFVNGNPGVTAYVGLESVI